MKYCPQCKADINLQIIDGEERRACSVQCGFVFWDNPTPVVAVVVETPDGVVLAHNKLWPENVCADYASQSNWFVID